MDSFIEVDAALRAEADELLDRSGLLELLSRFGITHVSGSYALRLMTWRDLDVYLETTDMTVSKFLELGKCIAELLGPMKMSFINNWHHAHPENPRGLYWGVRLGDVRQGAWKIDLWAMEPIVCRAALEKGRLVGDRLTEEARRTILALKTELWRHPSYRGAITSQTIYDAVLTWGVTDLRTFWAFAETRGNRPIDKALATGGH
jgi:hypothetical protein